MKPLFPPPSTSEVRRILAPYFEMALDVPELLVSIPSTIHSGGTDWPVVKTVLRPQGEVRRRLLVVAGLSPYDRGSTDAVFHATLRLLQAPAGHTELVAYPLADPLAWAAGAPAAEEEVRAIFTRELASERYDGLLVLHDDPLTGGLSFRLPPEEASLNLAADLLQQAGFPPPLLDLQHQGGQGGRLAPLEPGDLDARGGNEGSSIVLHALLPALQGRAACAKQGAEVILDVLQHFGALEELWRKQA
ncbi:hypothetical protein OKA04_09815 [Luteolibacter flavescens]|uniref:Uncharacterized protein n=1 Tax=Luteolibacter flavescens TaxID=1859460 RepID=A0ABT3FN70_9BACT|nr:hypothetical protein [Luteolibacter flavescens]MCW1885023.1 hypothetical protein [Luteolibacter flavescens]